MSSTGFVTFLDHTTVTNASSSPLTHKPNALEVDVAPEPRDIMWENVHTSQGLIHRREAVVDIFLIMGAILW